MLKRLANFVIFASAWTCFSAFSAPTFTLSFSTKDGVLSLYSGETSLGRFPNVLISNGAMSSIVENSTAGTPLIRIATDGSRNKYDIVVPIIQMDGSPYTNCVYKSGFDSNEGNRSVGVSCSLTPLRQFDPEAAVGEQHLIKYRTGFPWLQDAISKKCATPLGIEYGSYHIALCADHENPDPSQETTIVYSANGKRIFSVRGYEIIPGGVSEGEFAVIGSAGERITFYTSNFHCLTLPELSNTVAPKTGSIGKYRIQYSARTVGDCAYGKNDSYDPPQAKATQSPTHIAHAHEQIK
ncbi:hypothetical protein [Burkholderia sp. SRS-W-2-2016]|uniref:hypothetical protein n=1 Tax=Burkholderia sp. SRS-W-2-2016 TaxID=1926878 RepID=UPI000A6AD6C2|nr:hypothetical protein [Burkholderia sp. SRS-W-2-2016]